MAADVGAFEVLKVARFILRTHLHSVKDMYCGARNGNAVFQRRHQIGIELIENAFLPDKLHILRTDTKHLQHPIHVRTFLLGLLFQALLHPAR